MREAVKTALTKVGDMKDQWPADKNESYRIVSHYVLAQLFADQQQAGAPGAAQPAAGQAQPQPATPAQPQ